MIRKLRDWARDIKADTYALYLAYRDPRTPWYARAVAVAVAAYAFSPIDLIPDFIPVIGYLDDLILVPLGILLAFRLLPPDVLDESRETARTLVASDRSIGRYGLIIVAGIWLTTAIVGLLMIQKIFG